MTCDDIVASFYFVVFLIKRIGRSRALNGAVVPGNILTVRHLYETVKSLTDAAHARLAI